MPKDKTQELAKALEDMLNLWLSVCVLKGWNAEQYVEFTQGAKVLEEVK